MLSLLFIILCMSSVQVTCQVQPQNVMPLEFHITLNETHCYVSKNDTAIEEYRKELRKARFVHKGALNCGQQNQPTAINNVLSYVKSNFEQTFVENASNFKNRQCWFLDANMNCYFDFNYEIDPPLTNKTKALPEPERKPEGDPNLYVYVGVGVGIIILIVIVQTAYIIIYRRKVANTRRALNTVLLTRKEKPHQEERYSTGPFKKRKSRRIETDGEEENIYESVEILPGAEKKGLEDSCESLKEQSPPPDHMSDTVSRNTRARQQMPLPSELQMSQDDLMKRKIFSRLPLPLPPELELSQQEVLTFPYKNDSQEKLAPRFEQPNHSTVPRRRPNIPSKQPVINELNQLLKKRSHHVSTSNVSCQALKLESSKLSPNLKYLPPPQHHQSSLNIPRQENTESPKVSPKFTVRHNYRPPPQPHHVSTPSVAHQAVRKMSRIPPTPMPKKPRQPDPESPPPVASRPAHDCSSDEEWTYEPLHPMKNYLR